MKLEKVQTKQGATGLYSGLHRDLKVRHLTMIAIGGTVGTGLFVSSGATIAQAGPGGAMLSYVLIGVMVYFLMTSLAELATFMPVPGSFAVYGTKYVEEGFGFALGWNYWYNWIVVVAVELVASQMVMGYWFPDISGSIWSALFLAIIFLFNFFSVKGFGESEYWFSLIKVATVIVFIVAGLLMIVGILKGSQGSSWHNWTVGQAPFVGGFPAMIAVSMIVGFSFQGVELIGVAAGESENPSRSIKRSVRQIFWRILLFYILSILIISLIIPYTDPRLLRTGLANISVSPFTLVFQNAGLLSAAAVMNAVILSAILSTGNSGVYAATRTLFTLAQDGKAPRMFASLSKGGVPRNALIISSLATGICFLTSKFDNQAIYLWLLNTGGMTGFIAWLGVSVSHYRFRRGYVLQGNDPNDLPYRAGFFPFGPIFTFILCVLVTLGQNYQSFLADKINWYSVLGSYLTIPVFLVLWWGYKLSQGTHFVKYRDMDFSRTKID